MVLVGYNSNSRRKKFIRRSFFKRKSRVVEDSLPIKRLRWWALLFSWALWTGGRMTICNCGRPAGFFIFPIKHNRWLPSHFLLRGVNQNFKVDNACCGKGANKQKNYTDMVCIKINSIQKDQSLWQVSESSGRAWLWWKDLSRATDCWCTFCDLSGVVRKYTNDSACCPREIKEIGMYSPQ